MRNFKNGCKIIQRKSASFLTWLALSSFHTLSAGSGLYRARGSEQITPVDHVPRCSCSCYAATFG